MLYLHTVKLVSTQHWRHLGSWDLIFRVGEALSFNLVYYTCMGDVWELRYRFIKDVRRPRVGRAEFAYMSGIYEFCSVLKSPSTFGMVSGGFQGGCRVVWGGLPWLTDQFGVF